MNDGRQHLVDFYLQRAEETLEDARSLAQNERWYSAMNRLYYACFYAVQAALHLKINLRVKTHSGIKTLFNLHIVKEGLVDERLSSFYSLLMQRRGESDYGDLEKPTDSEVKHFMSRAEEFIGTIKKIIRQQ